MVGLKMALGEKKKKKQNQTRVADLKGIFAWKINFPKEWYHLSVQLSWGRDQALPVSLWDQTDGYLHLQSPLSKAPVSYIDSWTFINN